MGWFRPPSVFMPEIKTRETSQTSKLYQEMYLSPLSSYEEEDEEEYEEEYEEEDDEENKEEIEKKIEEEIEKEDEKENENLVHVEVQHTNQNLNFQVSNGSEPCDQNDKLRGQSILRETSINNVSPRKSSPKHRLNEELGNEKNLTPTNEILTKKINYLQERFQNNQHEASKSRTKLKEILRSQKDKDEEKVE